MAYRLGVDVGGTFTDLLLFNDLDGSCWRHKTPSTPHDQSEGTCGVGGSVRLSGRPPSRRGALGTAA